MKDRIAAHISGDLGVRLDAPGLLRAYRKNRFVQPSDLDMIAMIMADATNALALYIADLRRKGCCPEGSRRVFVQSIVI